MTRKSKRELEKDVEEVRDEVTPEPEFSISSTVVTITEDMVDDRGDLVDEATVPEDATLLPTESPVVTWWSTTE